MTTSAARTVGGKACGPRALDGRVGRARPDPRCGKRVNPFPALVLSERTRIVGRRRPPSVHSALTDEAADGRADHRPTERHRARRVERSSARARLVDVSFYHPAPDARKWSARVGSTRPHIIVRASKGWCRAGSLVQPNGSVASAVEKAFNFSHLPLTPRTRSSDHAR